jgi:HK97 family phage portal protein
MGFQKWFSEKLSPAQQFISGGGTTEESSNEPLLSYQLCYEKLEVVNRAVNMLVDDVAEIKNVVGEQIPGMTPFVKGVRKVQLNRILNKEPNPFQDINSFKRALILDFVVDGNIFIYWDGAYMYHLPATKIKVVADKDTFINRYEFNSEGGVVRYTPEEIIHVKDNNYQTIYRGSSRLRPALRTMQALFDMRAFQDNFFKNGAVPGLSIRTDERLNERHKEKLLQEWGQRYNPKSGGRRPIILDGGLKIDPISTVNFKELDFQNSIAENEKVVLKALGIPPLLLDGGNNVNIRPNHRIYYLETVLPIVSKINSAIERFFGFEVYEDVTYIHALRPELRDEAAYYQTLVNSGILTPNEARDAIGMPAISGHDDLRIPANIAGSAADPSQGGRPTEGTE